MNVYISLYSLVFILDTFIKKILVDKESILAVMEDVNNHPVIKYEDFTEDSEVDKSMNSIILFCMSRYVRIIV